MEGRGSDYKYKNTQTHSLAFFSVTHTHTHRADSHDKAVDVIDSLLLCKSSTKGHVDKSSQFRNVPKQIS